MSEGWIDWTGGECPVAPDTKVFVRLLEGFTDDVPGLDPDPAKFWEWQHIGRMSDIIAYRVVQP